MGSEAYARLGLGRSKEGALDYPDKYTVVGVDVDADKLIARYKGSRGEKYAAEVVRAVVQKYRTAGDPPDYFVRSLTGGVNEPIILTDLGPDAKGKSWAVVVDGRQRALGLRIVNDRNAASKPPLPRLQLAAVFRAFKRDGAGLAAALVKVTSNVRVARTFTQRADDVLDLDGRGVAHADIAPLVEASDAAEVALLVALAGCDVAVKDAVDAGRLGLAEVGALAKLSHEEQARRVTRATAAPKGANGKAAREARDKAAPPRAKSLPRPKALAIADAFRAAPRVGVRFTEDDIEAVVRHLLGEDGALHAAGVSDAVREIVKAASGKSGEAAS
jgi:hypothetical protein